MSQSLVESAALTCDQLAKTYVIGFFRKKVEAIREVTFRVERGEIFGLLGPNGAGKTTTLKILMGLIAQTRGSATLLGCPVGALEAKRRIGYLPESPYFYDYLTGQELLVLIGQLFGLTRSESRRRAGQLLELVGLERSAKLALRRYSKGMLQRIGVAQALINDPALVVLDEPLTGLDPLGRKQLRELIADLRTQGKTVILSSHILSDVELLADRVAILVHGRTVNCGPLYELVAARVLSTEVVAEACSEALVAAMGREGHTVRQIGATVQIVVAGDRSVSPLLDLIRQHQGEVRAVTPRQESLEDVVVKLATATADTRQRGSA